MTISEQQAKDIIKYRPNGDAVKIKQSKSQVLKAHVTGIGDNKLMTVIKNFERREYGETRIAMKMSNKDIIYRVMQPRNKIYSAKGGLESYTMRNNGLVEDFKIYLSSVRGTQSLKDYIRQNIQPMYDYDPEGLTWLDLNSYGNPYPCFKSIHQIWDYELSGRKPEYVAFTLSDKEIKQLSIRASDFPNLDLRGKLIQPPAADGSTKKINKVFRVVCDSYDRIIVWDNVGEPTMISEIANPFSFMGVPGMVVSNIVGAGTDYEDICYDSPLSPALDILSQAMFSRSLYNVAFTRCAYPKEWMQEMPCPTCNATGLLDNAKCPECKGTKAMPAQLHSDTLIIDYRNDENKSIPTPPMGHVEPAVEALQFMKDAGYSWEDMFEHTMWGVAMSLQGNLNKSPNVKNGNIENTAYQAMQNEQPKHDKLTDFSTWASEVYKWYADGCGKYIYQQSYVDSGIMFGKRFMVESADATFDRLVKARTGGATKSELDSLTIEFLENKYKDDPISYRKYYILFIAEPFYHDSIADVITWDIPDINKMEKIFFDEWSATLPMDYFASCPDDGLEPKVKNDLRQYVLTRVDNDNQADALLFDTQGKLLNIGDTAMVKRDKAMNPTHMGQTFKVTAINSRYATVTDNTGAVINGYQVTDMIKQTIGGTVVV
jgi:hypothetical protein